MTAHTHNDDRDVTRADSDSNSRTGRDGRTTHATNTGGNNGDKSSNPSGGLHPKELARREAVADFPYLALTVQSSGIHPSTARLVAVDAVTFNEAGDTGESFHAVLNSGEDPGPRHYHGLSREEVNNGQRFSKILKPLDRLIDDRTLIVHDLPLTWGFLVSEAKQAMSAAARANRKRSRKGNRKRQRVGHVPQPARIVDTLATARRQEINFHDIRAAGVARAMGLSAISPVASVVRASRSQEETSREITHLLWEIFLLQQDAAAKKQDAAAKISSNDYDLVAAYTPDELRADRFGLQRPHVRVEAAEAKLTLANPGKYEPGRSLVEGMEVVVADEIGYPPETIIEALTNAGLVYREHLHRGVSVVVCNQTTDLRGKAMHAVRKGIPLLGDTAFLDALTRVKPHPDPDAPVEQSTHPRALASSGAVKSGGQKAGGKSAAAKSSPGKSATAKTSAAKPSKPAKPVKQKSEAKPRTKPGANSADSQTGGAKSTGKPAGKSRRNKRRRSRTRKPHSQPGAQAGASGSSKSAAAD